MSFTVDVAWVNSYHSAINLLSQQFGSRLANAVRNETQSAEFDFWDRIDATAAQEVTSRHGDTPLISSPHDRRRVGLRQFDWADLIDKWDRVRMIADPTSSYVQNAVLALGRSKDQVIIDAAFGTAFSGKTGATSVTFPASQEVAVNYVETGGAVSSNLTIAKLRKARSILATNEAIHQVMGSDGIVTEEPTIAVVAQSQIDALLRTTEVTSEDYNTVKALVRGEIDTFLGFRFIRTQLLTVTTNIRECIFYAQSGLLLSTAAEIMTTVDRRPDKRNSVQVYACGAFGATRMEEKKVVRVKCDETA